MRTNNHIMKINSQSEYQFSLRRVNLMPAQTSHKLPRKERERNQHRLEVLEAAEMLFASRGFHRTLIQDIAEAAEFSVGKIYTLFESKEDLYASLMDMRAKEIYELTMATHSEEGTSWEKVKRGLIALLEFLDSHKEFVHILIYETVGFPSKLRGGISEGFDEYYIKTKELVHHTFQEGVASGEFVNADATDLSIAMEGIAQMFCAQEASTHPEARLLPLADRILKVFANQLVKDTNI
jgi:AcrR family transcriptional regulator